MKKTIAIAALAAASIGCAPADPVKEESSALPEITQSCEDVYHLAERIASVRNSRERIIGAHKVIGGDVDPELTKVIVNDAYSQEPVVDKMEAASAGTEFASQWFMKCEKVKDPS